MLGLHGGLQACGAGGRCFQVRFNFDLGRLVLKTQAGSRIAVWVRLHARGSQWLKSARFCEADRLGKHRVLSEGLLAGKDGLF